jgi:hypothetical protein
MESLYIWFGVFIFVSILFIIMGSVLWNKYNGNPSSNQTGMSAGIGFTWLGVGALIGILIGFVIGIKIGHKAGVAGYVGNFGKLFVK